MMVSAADTLAEVAMLRARIGWLLVVATLLASASSAGAYTLTLVPTTPDWNFAAPGDLLAANVVVDTEGASSIISFSVSLGFDDTVIQYRPDLSDAADYILYDYGGGKNETWMNPAADPPALVSPSSWDFVDSQVDLAFSVNTWPGGSTVAAGTNVLLGTLVFEAGGPPGSYSLIQFGIGGTGNHFAIEGVAPADPTFVNLIGHAYVAPEPGTVLLVSIGLFGLGRMRRRRR
jgi:hypothetical protein